MDKVKLVFRMNFQGCEILPYCIINHCGVFRHLVSFHTFQNQTVFHRLTGTWNTNSQKHPLTCLFKPVTFPMWTYYRVKTCLKSKGIVDLGELEMVDSCFLLSTLFICMSHTITWQTLNKDNSSSYCLWVRDGKPKGKTNLNAERPQWEPGFIMQPHMLLIKPTEVITRKLYH